MKRTLTAAATLLAGSAGVVGFAGTAAAADTPQLPAELPVDNSVAQTAYHAAGTMHSATQVVGDVVPAPDKLTGSSARAADGGSLGGVAEDLGLDKVLSGAPLSGVTGKSGTDGASQVGQLPLEQLPTEKLPTEQLPVGKGLLG